MGLSWDEERWLLPRRSRVIRPHRRPRGFPGLRVSDRTVVIARALQARTWAEQFHVPPHAVVKDSGGYRGTLGDRAETLSRQGNPQREQRGRFGGRTGGVRKTRPVMLLETGRQPVRPATPTISNERPVVSAYRAA